MRKLTDAHIAHVRAEVERIRGTLNSLYFTMEETDGDEHPRGASYYSAKDAVSASADVLLEAIDLLRPRR